MITEAVYLHYLNAILQGDKQQCIRIVENLLDSKVELKDIYLHLFQRSLYRIGKMWESRRCSVAEEHIATKITESLIDFTLLHCCCENKSNKSVVISCVDKEFHEIGARMVAALFEVNGWNTLFLGSNTPREELVEITSTHRPDIVGISANLYLNISRLIKSIDRIKSAVPDQEILIGGQALSNGLCESLVNCDNVKYINSLDDLSKYIEHYKSKAEG